MTLSSLWWMMPLAALLTVVTVWAMALLLTFFDALDRRICRRIQEWGDGGASKSESVTPSACIPPNRGHDAGREE